MESPHKTVAAYCQALPPDRRAAIQTVRETILANLPSGFEECMAFGSIAYVVPHRLYPAGYHCNPKMPLPFVNLVSQKNHLALHLLNIYGDTEAEEWFRAAWLATGKKLDLGKACLRFKKVEDLSLEVLGSLIARTTMKQHIARFEKLAKRKK